MKRLVVVTMAVALLSSLPLHAGNGNGKGKSLPPGLQKKVAAGQPLPPGWQKKVRRGEPLDTGIYAHRTVISPVDDRGHEVIQVEDRVYKVIKNTREIIDILN